MMKRSWSMPAGWPIACCKSKDDSDDERIQRGMSLVLGRKAEANEVAILREELLFQRRYFQSHPEAVSAILAVGDSKPDESLESVELAAMTSVARVLLNLDETLTKSDSSSMVSTEIHGGERRTT